MRVQVPLGEFQCDCPWPYSGPGCEVNGAPSRKPRDDNSNDPLWNRNGNCMDWFNDPTFGSELTEACCEVRLNSNQASCPPACFFLSHRQ